MATAVIVDDNRETCQLLARLLQRHGHAAICTANAEEAWEAVQRFRPDLLILDIRLPGPSGIDLLRSLRQDAAIAATTVVVVSGIADMQLQAEAFHLGVDDYIVKGIDWNAFWERIEPHLQGK